MRPFSLRPRWLAGSSALLLSVRLALACGGEDPVAGSAAPPTQHDAGAEPADAGASPFDATAAPAADAALPSTSDAAVATGSGCQLGSAGSFATDMSLDLFGNVIYFANGQTLPKGRYRVAYADGCMKYNTFFLWTVNSKPDGSDGWWLVGDSSAQRVSPLPGTGGFLPPDAFVSFEECVAANRTKPATEFDFEGGKLGIWLNDVPYNDNQAGEGGRNPKWSLTLQVETCPPDIVLQ